MSEYYAEHESIERLGEQARSMSSDLSDDAMAIGASSKVLARSQTLESFGYSNLTNRAQTSVNKLSDKVKDISGVLDKVANLYESYEGRVIAALDDSTGAGNNFSPDSRHETRGMHDIHIAVTVVISGEDGASSPSNVLIDYVNPTPEQKRNFVHSWLEQTHPELLEQIYDKLHENAGVAGVGLGVAGAAVGLGAASVTPGAEAGLGAQQASSQSGVAADTGQGGAGGFATDAVGDTGSVDTGAMDAGGADMGDAGAGDAGAGGAGSGASDFASDMLNDAVDSQAAQQAQQDVAQAANTSNPEAISTGTGALSDSADMGFAADESSGFSQFMSSMGDNFIGAVQAYGLQVGILASGAGAAYASSGVTIEAVAHCAEFISTRCVPGVEGFMQQAVSTVRFASVSIRSVVSSVAQGVGGFIA